MTREAELAAIERFLASREATRCPAAYAAPTVGALPADEEARRLGRLKLKAPPTKQELMRALWCGLRGGHHWPVQAQLALVSMGVRMGYLENLTYN